jgi:hypothetical protein
VKTFVFERRWLAAIFAAVLPASDDPRFPEGADRLGVEAYVDALLDGAPRGFARGLRLCTWLLQLAPLLFLRRPVAFTALAPEARAALLERMAASDVYLVRELPMLFKTAACLGLCGLPAVQRRIGIQPLDTIDPDWARAGKGARRLQLAAGERP